MWHSYRIYSFYHSSGITHTHKDKQVERFNWVFEFIWTDSKAIRLIVFIDLIKKLFQEIFIIWHIFCHNDNLAFGKIKRVVLLK